MGIAKGSKVIQPGDKEIRNVYDLLLQHKVDLLEEPEALVASEMVKTDMALEFVEKLL